MARNFYARRNDNRVLWIGGEEEVERPAERPTGWVGTHKKKGARG